MSTVYRFDGLRVVIYSNDHRPAHVHVKGGKGEAVYILHCPDGPPELRESFGFQKRQLNRISERIREILSLLCDEWGDIHGH